MAKFVMKPPTAGKGIVRLSDVVAREMGVKREVEAQRVVAAPVDSLQDQPPPSVIAMIDDVLKARATPCNYFRPSGIGGCPRANVLHYWGAQENTGPSRTGGASRGIDPKLHRLLDTGTLTHRVIQGYLAEHPGIFFAPEVAVWYPTLSIRGHADGVIQRRSDGYKFLLEIKTKTHAGFTALTGPEEGHVYQASIYAKLCGIKWLTILYWDRDKNHMREFAVKAAASWPDVVSRVKWLKDQAAKVRNPFKIEDEDLPEYNAEVCAQGWDFCGYSDLCSALRGVPNKAPDGGRRFWK